MLGLSRKELAEKVYGIVRNLNIKTAEKREPVYTLSETLANKNVTTLRRLAKLCGLTGCSKMDKAKLLPLVATSMADPAVLSKHLLVLEGREWEFFKKAAGVRQITDDKLVGEHYRFMLELGIMAMFCHDGHFHYVVSREIQASYHELEKTGFAKDKERSDLLNAYAIAAANLYGVITQEDFVALFNSQNERQTDIDEVFGTLMRFVAMENGYCFYSEYIVNDDFEDDDYETVEDMAKAAAAKPRYIPSKPELLKYANWGYMEDTPQLRRLREYVFRHIPGDRELAGELLHGIYEYGNYEADPSHYIELFEERGLRLSESQTKELLPMIIELRNNTRLWMHNGHTPNEIHANARHVGQNEPVKVVKIGRNEPCPCGSGKKYKKCCGR